MSANPSNTPETQPKGFPFTKKNYTFMLTGIGMILLGMLVISMDSTPYGSGFMGLTLGPIILFSGFMFGIFAILYKEKTA
ncbi:MAG: DUF3098 domain-containing protein [Cytophagales bacterium]|nr:MAG: DUF3098 domain-containing protein [Cytophagales bacterium]TAF61367.1 MAG: DUF3098 domain-containing protein [Cytophagales bacterium]